MTEPDELPRLFLTSDDAKQIKELLWEGIKTQQQIAEEFGVQQPMISRILRGHAWAKAPWPDGSIGPMPTDRYQTIIRSKRTAAGHKNLRVANRITEESYNGAVEIRSAESPLKLETLPWEKVLERDPANPLLSRAREDDQYKLAVCTVFKAIPQGEWATQATRELVEEVYQKLGG